MTVIICRINYKLTVAHYFLISPYYLVIFLRVMSIHHLLQVAQLSQRDRAARWVSFGPQVEEDVLQTVVCLQPL